MQMRNAEMIICLFVMVQEFEQKIWVILTFYTRYLIIVDTK